MLSIVYASSAVRLLDNRELIDLLEACRKANEQHGITGMLLYRGGNFIQVIEGEDDAVLQLYENIKADPRHRQVSLLSKDPIVIRQFPNWSMGFKNIDQLTQDELQGYSNFFDNDFNPNYFKERPARAYILLLTFKEAML